MYKRQAPHFKGPLKFIDSFIYDPKKHEKDAEEAAKQPHEPPEDEPEELDDEDEPIEPRDYQPIRGRRDGKTGCLGGLMYFAFVVSLSIILACVVWMAASDVLALNKPLEDGTVTLPQSIFTEKVIEVENEDCLLYTSVRHPTTAGGGGDRRTGRERLHAGSGSLLRQKGRKAGPRRRLL